MGLSLHGRTALITGASSGIGAATAAALAARGCHLVLAGRDKAALTGIAETTGGQVLVADLAAAADLDRVAAAANDADLLVNNAGIGWAGELAAVGPAEIDALVAVNLTAPMRLTRAALPAMTRRGFGHLVFVSSIATVGVRGEAVYSGTKAGLRSFAASVRYESTPHGIGVTTVLPGAVSTPFFSRRGTPYDRSFPRPVSAAAVARALVRAVEQGRGEVFVPGWLSVAARLQGAMPGVFYQLAHRFS